MKLPKIYWVNVFDEMAYLLMHWALIMSFALAAAITIGIVVAVVGALASMLA